MERDRRVDLEFLLFHARASVGVQLEEIEDTHQMIERIENESRSSKKMAKFHEGRIEYIQSHILPLLHERLKSAKEFVIKYETELEQLAYQESDGQLEFNF